MSINMFASIPLVLKFLRAMWMNPHACLHMQWVPLWERNPDLREHKSFLMNSKLPRLLLWKETIFQVSSLYKYLEKKVQKCRNARETQGKLSLIKSCLLGGSTSSSSSAVTLKDNCDPVIMNSLKIWTRREESALCWALRSRLWDEDSYVNDLLKKLSQNNPVKEWGGSNSKGEISGQVLW